MSLRALLLYIAPMGSTQAVEIALFSQSACINIHDYRYHSPQFRTFLDMGAVPTLLCLGTSRRLNIQSRVIT